MVYLFALASDSILSDISTDVDSDHVFAIDALSSLHVPIKSSFMTDERKGDAHGTFFKVPARRKGQKPILFGRIEPKPVIFESSGGDSDSLQFFQYGSKSHHMMKRMGYDLTKKSDLNFGKEK